VHLKGKRVVVTGGSSGIGLALAGAMLGRGARVAIVGRRQVELDQAVAELRALGPSVAAVVADVTRAAPILLTREALPHLRKSGHGLIVNVTSAAALTGAPLYGSYTATKAGLARFGEAPGRKLKGEGVGVLTVHPIAIDTPMMATSKAGADLGFGRESVVDVAAAIVEGIEVNALEVARGGDARAKLIVLNREDPLVLDERFFGIEAELEAATRDHKAL
jgi:uncharacterized oxidoreductase